MKVYTQMKLTALVTILIIVCCCFNSSYLRAAEPEWIHVLAGNIVNVKTEQGKYVWLAIASSPKTIYKFHLSSNSITDSINFRGDFLEYDNKGNLWIAQRNGLAKYKDNILTDYSDSSYNNIKLKDISIISMKIDNNDNVWLGTIGAGIFKFDGQNIFIYDSKNSDVPMADFERVFPVTSIDFDIYNNGWFGFSNGGIAKFSGNSWTFYNDTNSALPENKINDIKADKSGNVWISTSKGLTKFDGQNWTTFKNDNPEVPVAAYGQMSLDKSDNIWFYNGYDKGVAKFDGNNFEVLNIENSELLGTAVMSVFVDSYDNKWFSVINGDTGYRGVDIYNENGIILTSVNENNENISGISVYPNPTTDFITIQPSEGWQPSEGYKVQLFDMLGIEIISTPSLHDTPQEGNFRIDVSGLQSGVYYIRIGDRVEKFVKI